MDDQWDLVLRHIAVLKERFVYGEVVDPVFEGVVRDFERFDATINSLYNEIISFLRQVEQLSGSLLQTSESIVKHLSQSPDPYIISDSLKFKEAMQMVARSDAPHSALAKLRRDLEYNLTVPLRSHVINNRQVKQLLGERKNKLLEVTASQKVLVDAEKSGNQRKALAASQEFEIRRREFDEIDRTAFDWLCILEEYKDDISDSTLQTLKYLQYEFFATTAHAIAKVLPPRMEFRPMVEMTPKQLESQIELEKEEEKIAKEEDQSDSPQNSGRPAPSIGDYSTKIMERMEKARLARSPFETGDVGQQITNVPVDPLSLSVLLSHGFDEGAARRALRTHNNDTQAALEFLLNPPSTTTYTHHAPTLVQNVPNPASLAVRVATEEGEDAVVRMPATLARIQRLKEVKKKIGERNSTKEKLRDERTGERLTTLADSGSQAAEAVADSSRRQPELNLIDFEENNTVPLPEKKSLIDDDFWK